ncbi:hypothetical protein [Pelagibius sp.]|uniref:hypothetical protein n=1 Tax=Pelagibius sp. TaxID=1931238 RepID=UPI003BB110DD
MTRALSQNLETIAALQSFCVFGYETDDSLADVTSPDYFTSVASRLMANDLLLICADTEREPAWGLFLVSAVAADGVELRSVTAMPEETVGGLLFRRAGTIQAAKRRGAKP